jgi:alpha-D-ribose 1-methylphosphonate 5-phosphate C-P lyase
VLINSRCRKKGIYAIPPHKPFRVQRWEGVCERCGSRDSYLNAVAVDDRVGRMLICSDTDYGDSRLEAGLRSSP